MNRIKDYKELQDSIVSWIKNYAESNGIKSLVVGVSGGIDSAVVSTLCAMTGIRTFCQIISVDSNVEHLKMASRHIKRIQELYGTNSLGKYIVTYGSTDLTKTYNTFTWETMGKDVYEIDLLSLANIKSRLRMMALYAIAGEYAGIVVGTGNKIEDFGIGFFTKHGDGGVDISPIADLYKTEVRELGRYMGIAEEILNAAPTDGLFPDNRTDEQQIGCTYEELEWAMDLYDRTEWTILDGILPFKSFNGDGLTTRQMKVLSLYADLNRKNQHKILPIPVYKLPA